MLMKKILINPRVTTKITSVYKSITLKSSFKTKTKVSSGGFLYLRLFGAFPVFSKKEIMKKLIFFCSVLALGSAKPGGFFHQEYSYKSSSASYKNNELQHKNEDQGFYSKDGDLEGRVKPKVNSQSQHSEYTNPKLLSGSNGYQSAGYSGAGGANYMASSDRLFGGVNGAQNVAAVDGYASSDRVLDLSNVYNRGYSASHGIGSNQGFGTSQSNYGGRYVGGGSKYGYTQGGSSYGYLQHGSSQATSGSYATNANLNALMQRLQDDMTRQLETAIYNQYQTSGYTTSVSGNQMNADIRLLEDELRRNLTRQLQDSLRTQYGTSTYTVVEGRPSTVPNYSSQELAALTRRLEDDLIGKLHQSIRTTYNRETSNTYTSSGNTYRPVVVYQATTSRPYYNTPIITTPSDIRYTLAPSREIITPYQRKVVIETPSNIRYTPIANPDSLTQIASRTQADINSYLDTALQNLYSTYLQTDRTSYYTVTDFDNEVNRIRDEIIRNLTINMDDEIRRNYGQQILKNDYYYTISSNGDMSTQYNYHLRDYENLKKQVEENLLRKLNQTVNTYRDQYQRLQSQYRESSSSYAVTYRPVYYTSGNQLYDYSDLQRQMSQQVQNALNKHRYSQSSSYSASASYNPQAYQTSLDELSRELQRNLTEQLNNYRAQASSSSSSSYGYMSGGGSGNADFESMKNQLQSQLMQQLRQGLQNQHHYSASASYSASSSSSANANYGMHQSYGSYPSTCMHGCTRRKRDLYPYLHNSGVKRLRHGVKSARRYSPSRETSFSTARYNRHPEDMSYANSHSMQSSYNGHYPSSHITKHNSREEPDIVEDLGIYGQPRVTQQQSEQSEDDLQQLKQEPSRNTMKYAKQNELTQQQTEDTEPLQPFRNTVVFGQATPSRHEFSTQLEDQNDLTQQLESEAPILKQEQYTLSKSNKLDQKPNRYDQDQEGQLILGQQTEGQQLEDQNTIGHLQKAKDQETEGQLTLSQQTDGQQLENQETIGRLQKPKDREQETEGQLTLSQQTEGQQLENQETIGRLQNPKDQELQGQLTLGQQSEGQQLEDQNTIGQLNTPTDQETEGQLILGQQPEGQHLENQETIRSLQKPKDRDQETEGQLTLSQQTEGQQLGNQETMGSLQKPKDRDQETEGQLTLGQQTDGQQLEDQNTMGKLTKPKDQETEGQLTLGQESEGQQLENQETIGRLQKPRDRDQETEGKLTLSQQTEGQQLENQETIGHLQKPRDQDQETEGKLTLSQQTEGQQLENQQTIGHLQNPDQELEGQLTLGPKSEGQQLEDQNNIGQLNKPKDQETEGQLTLSQQTEGQQLENQETIGHLQNPKNQELEGQLTLGQQSEGQQLEDQNNLGPLNKPKDQQTEGQLTLGQQTEGQQLEDQESMGHLQKSEDQETEGQLTLGQQTQGQQLEDQETVGRLRNPKDQEHEGQLTLGQQSEGQQLENQNTTGHWKKPRDQQTEGQLTLGQQTEGQQLENQETMGHFQKSEDQETEGQLTLGQQTEGQQLENQETIGLLQKPKDQETEGQLTLSQKTEGQQLQNQETIEGHVTLAKHTEELNQQLELTNVQKPKNLGIADQEQQLEMLGGTRKPNNGYFPNLGVSPESELSFSSEIKQRVEQPLTSNSFSPERTFRQHSQYSSSTSNTGSYMHGSDQRPFTNGHSGHSIGDNSLTLDNQEVDTFGNALKQQDALLDLLKKKVQESQSSGNYLSSTYNSQSQSPGYSGSSIRSTYHVTGNSPTFAGRTQWLTQGTSFGEPSLPYSGSTQSEFSGKTTRRVVHYVNGKPISASENIQVLTPTGEIIEKNRDLAPEELSSFTHGFSSIHSINEPQSYFNRHNSDVSTQTIRRTAHFVNGKLVDFTSSSQDNSPNGRVNIVHGFPSNEDLAGSYNTSPFNFHSSSTKNSKNYGRQGY